MGRHGARGGTPSIRVCHVIHSLQEGGAEHLLLTLARVAPSAGLDLSVLSLMPDDGLRFARQLRQMGVAVDSLALSTRWDPRALLRAARLIQQSGAQVVHTHLKHADLVGAYAAHRLGLPMVSTLHVIEDRVTPRKRLKRRLAAQARLRAADLTIAVSDAQRRWYLEAFPAEPDRVITVRNGVLPPAHAAAPTRAAIRRQLDAGPDQVVCTLVAILRPGKGVEDLLTAVLALPPELDVRVIIAGDGPEHGAIRRRVEEHPGLRQRVVMAGFVDDIQGLLAASDVVVHPSHFDALPTALIYALAAGAPIVATEVGGIPEIVTPETGILVPPRDPEALAAAITQLASDPMLRRRLGAGERRRYEAEFHAEVWARRLRERYEALLSSASH